MYDYKATATYQVPLKYVFTWHSLSDACPRCQSLNGQEWHDQDIFQEVLWDSIWGDVWDLNQDVSLAHGGPGHNCRCQLEVRVLCDWNAVPEIKELGLVLSETVNVKLEELEVEEATDLGQIEAIRNAVSGLNQELEGMKWNYHELREFETIFRRTLYLVESATGSKDLQRAINLLQRFMSTVRVAQFTWLAFETATGPLGWVMAASSALMLGSYVYSLGAEMDLTRPTYSG